MKSISKLIDELDEHMPEQWEVNITIQKDYVEVIVTRPDGTCVHMGDGESDIQDQLDNVRYLIRNETSTEGGVHV